MVTTAIAVASGTPLSGAELIAPADSASRKLAKVGEA